MLDRIPTDGEMIDLIGEELYGVWQKLVFQVNEKYDMDCIWNNGGKKWTYEYKYRRGGKTLCALYAKKDQIGFMIIFGKDERTKFEANRILFSSEIQSVYDEAQTYHDGKWVMFEPIDSSMFEEFIRLLSIKRKPNR